MKTRFCPSPTGLMHLGNLRTALFSKLLAVSEKSPFLLRIEDTDLARSDAEYAEKLMSDLKWMHCDWDEGPDYQSKRAEIYQKYYQQLIDDNKAYWCFCSETELTIMRKSQLAAGHPPRYPGTCRHLTDEQIEQKKAKGIVPALRFQIPDNEKVPFEDFIQGPKVFETNDIGDFIIKKADGSPSFMFCNAIDDALMGVTHVLRGEDHLTNTPRQLLILAAIGLTAPGYGHMPLIVGDDGKPLSKRNGSQSVEALREQGYLPLAIANYLARLGHHFVNEKLLSFLELGQNFAISQIGRAPARFDIEQLKHWQKEAVMQLSDEECWQWISNTLTLENESKAAFLQAVKENIVFPTDADFWAKQLLTEQFVVNDQAKAILTEVDSDFYQALFACLEEFGADYAAVHKQLSEKTGRKGKQLFKPLRAIITGCVEGPQLGPIFALMGKERLIARVEAHNL